MKIELNQISKVIKNRIILQNINMQMESGHIYAFVGTNGSGKTMLMRILCGLVYASSGSVICDGKEVNFHKKAPYSLGVIIEKPEFFNEMDALENLMILANLNHKIKEEDVIAAIKKVGLNAADIKKVGEYSLGMRQRLGIAQAIMENPDVLVLDEPTGGLDEDGLELIYNILKGEREKGKLIIISSHQKEDIKTLSDVIYVFRNQTVIHNE